MINFISQMLLAVIICCVPMLGTAEDLATNEPSQEIDSDSNSQFNNKLDPLPQSPPPGLLPSEIIQVGTGDPFAKYVFLVDKTTRSLSIWQSDPIKELELVDLYPIDMGKIVGNKQSSGDQKTPEGVYHFIATKSGAGLDYSQYGQQAFVMDYPNTFDLRQRKTGSGIWLHAIPETKTLRRGSRGCVVVRNQAIKNLNSYMRIGKTSVIVTEKSHYLEKAAWKKEQAYWLGWLETWRRHWETGNMTDYIKTYSSAFRSQGKNVTQWERYKTKLSKQYSFIKVGIKHITIFKQQDQILVKFIQHYQSPNIADYGEKTLFLKNSDLAGFKIIAEDWKALAIKRPIASQTKDNLPTTMANTFSDTVETSTTKESL